MSTAKKIYITNTGVSITPYTTGLCKKLEFDTSKWNDVYHRYDPVIGFQVPYLQDDEQDVFVTTKNTPDYMKALFPSYSIEYMDEVVPKKLGYQFGLNDNIVPTDVQSDVINEILKKSMYHEWFVNLQTSLGKTLLSVYLTSIFNVKTLIMCYSTDILFQWVKTIKEKTTFDPSRILVLDASRLMYSIYTGDFDTDKYDIFIATPKLIVSFCKKYGFSVLNPTFQKMGIGLKIFDEAHRNISNMVKINGASNIRKTLYLSADFGQADRDKEKLYYKMMYGVPVIKPSEEVMNELKYTQGVVIEYNSNPSETESKKVYGRFGFSSTNYMRYQFDNCIVDEVLDFVLRNITDTNAKGYKVLILVSLINHVDTLYDKMVEMYGDKKHIGKFHSEASPEDREFAKDNADIIISTYQSFGTGIDVANIKYVISIDQCNKISDNQAAGRARPLSDGSDAFYIMLVDKGFSYSVKKLKSRLNYLTMTKIKNITKIPYHLYKR